jgi:hypothetical protein
MSNNLKRRYTRTSKLEDLERSISTLQEAINITSPVHESKIHFLNDLENRLYDKYTHTTRDEDLQRSISIARSIVDATSPKVYYRAVYLNNLGLNVSRSL